MLSAMFLLCTPKFCFHFIYQNGCRELLDRLKPLREEDPDISWEKLVSFCENFIL